MKEPWMDEAKHITNEEVQKDIDDTQKEIDQLEKENNALSGDPQKNRVRIYLNQGHILEKKDFIKSLNSLLEYRKSEEEL